MLVNLVTDNGQPAGGIYYSSSVKFTILWYVTAEFSLLFRSSRTLACSNSRVHTYGATCRRRGGRVTGGGSVDLFWVCVCVVCVVVCVAVVVRGEGCGSMGKGGARRRPASASPSAGREAY